MSTAALLRPAERVAAPASRAAWIVVLAFATMVVSVTLLQKLGLPAGGGGAIEVAVLAPWIAVAALLVHGRLSVEPVRLGLFAVFLLLVLLSQMLGRVEFSLSSILLAVALYLPFAFQVDVPRSLYLRCMKVFLAATLILAALVLMQDALQVTLGWRSWLNLDRLLPSALSVPGYNYLQPIGYGAGLYKPNAFFFLEGSFVSQFLALGLIVETALFQRPIRLAIYAVAILLSFSQSGLLLTALTLPFLIGRLSPRVLLGLAIAGVAAVVVALNVGWLAQTQGRFGEFNTPGSSGYFRYNVPLQIVGQMAGDAQFVFSGHGAGSTGKGVGQDVPGFILAPYAKLIYEFGFAAFLSFYAFLAYALFHRAPSIPVAVALFIFYSLGGGGFVVPVYVVTCLALGGLLRVENGSAPARVSEVRARRTRIVPHDGVVPTRSQR